MNRNHTHSQNQIEDSRLLQRIDKDFTAWQKTKIKASVNSYLPTLDEKAALAGTSGSPSAANKYVTNEGLTLQKACDNGATTTTGITAATGHFGGVANYSNFEADGTLVFNGDATVWNDIIVPITATGTGASAPGVDSILGSAAMQGLSFDGNATLEQVFGSFEIPHDYKEGTDIVVHVHWMPATAVAGNVVWQFEYSWVDNGGTFPATATIETVATAAGGTAWVHKKTDFPAISGAGKHIGGVIAFRFFRDPAHVGDTYNRDAMVLSIGVHYEIDTCGSRQITTK